MEMWVRDHPLSTTQNFQKNNIANPLIRTSTCAYHGGRDVVFRKILGTYLIDDPLCDINI